MARQRTILVVLGLGALLPASVLYGAPGAASVAVFLALVCLTN